MGRQFIVGGNLQVMSSAGVYPADTNAIQQNVSPHFEALQVPNIFGCEGTARTPGQQLACGLCATDLPGSLIKLVESLNKADLDPSVGGHSHCKA
jgi:hypothetical protein